MKYILITIIFIVFNFNLNAQTDWSKFEKIENVSSSNPSELAKKITQGFDTEKEKIQAIYYWITHNIKYDYKIVKKHAKQKHGKRKKYSPQGIKDKRAKLITTALKRKKGVCQDYSYIFETMCNDIGVDVEFISGIAKSGNSHAWNKVVLDGKTYFVDATYGAGGLNDKHKFAFDFKPNFLFVEPELFIINHLPSDEKNQALESPVSKDEFKKFPRIGAGFFKYKIKNLNHLEKKIVVSKEHKLNIQFISNEPLENFRCFNVKNSKKLDIEVSNTDLNYTITVDYKKLRSGKYVFLVGDDALFYYRIVKE